MQAKKPPKQKDIRFFACRAFIYMIKLSKDQQYKTTSENITEKSFFIQGGRL
jgi:hypothetical protein